MDTTNARSAEEQESTGAARLLITRGRPTTGELAAVVAAVHRREAERVAPSRAPARRTSRWQRAARLESHGHPPIHDPDDLGPTG